MFSHELALYLYVGLSFTILLIGSFLYYFPNDRITILTDFELPTSFVIEFSYFFTLVIFLFSFFIGVIIGLFIVYKKIIEKTRFKSSNALNRALKEFKKPGVKYRLTKERITFDFKIFIINFMPLLYILFQITYYILNLRTLTVNDPWFPIIGTLVFQFLLSILLLRYYRPKILIWLSGLEEWDNQTERWNRKYENLFKFSITSNRFKIAIFLTIIQILNFILSNFEFYIKTLAEYYQDIGIALIYLFFTMILALLTYLDIIKNKDRSIQKFYHLFQLEHNIPIKGINKFTKKPYKKSKRRKHSLTKNNNQKKK